MASITTDPDGRRTVQFVAADGKRRSIRLGKVPLRTAETVKVRVELLNGAVISGHAADDETARWVSRLGQRLADKLAAVGLLPKRQSSNLKAFLDDYIAGRQDVKGSTAIVYSHTRRNLISYFGADKPLREITAGDADKWRLWLIAEELADNTVRRRCGIAKQFFRAAVRRELVTKNPFADLTAAVKANESRYFFVSRDDAQKVIDACPSAEWRLMFALWRYGGLRCPSEHLALKWADVDWDRGRLRVRSPKTEHHEGGESRVIPIFPELRPHLEEAFELAPVGSEFVIARHRQGNLRKQLKRIITRAGLAPWPKLFQNLRSTRETELAETYPIHVACKWIGNTQAVAAKPYLQVTDDHFEQAAAAVQNPVQSVQKTVQQAAAGRRTTSQGMQKTPTISVKRDNFPEVVICPVGDEGLGPPTPSV